MDIKKIARTIKNRIVNIFEKKFVIGLDIGSSAVKMAQFAKTGKGPRLVKADLREIGYFEDEALREERIIAVIKELVEKIQIKKCRIMVSINCPATAIKNSVVPFIPQKELSRALSLEIKNYFYFPVDNSNMDFEILGDTVEEGVKKYKIEVSVSPVETVNRYLLLLDAAGIKPDSLIPASYALQKLSELQFSEKNKTVCFMDIGETNTELVILRDSELRFARKIPVAGGKFTKVMTEVLASDRGKTQLTLEEAEKIKKETGVPDDGDPEIIADKISTTQILSMLRTPLEQMISEIERCFYYYREETGEEKIDSLVLFGGGAYLKRFAEYLSEELGVEVKVGDLSEAPKAAEDVTPDKNDISGRFAVAVGAALAAVQGINLLPKENKEEVKRIVRRVTIETVGAAVLVIAVLFYIGLKLQLSNFEARSTVAKWELSSLEDQYKKAEAYHVANMVLVNEPHWEDVFKELSNIVPNGIYFTKLTLEDGIVLIEGNVNSSDGEQVISEFIRDLDEGIFTRVKLVKTVNLKNISGKEFVIRCKVE